MKKFRFQSIFIENKLICYYLYYIYMSDILIRYNKKKRVEIGIERWKFEWWNIDNMVRRSHPPITPLKAAMI